MPVTTVPESTTEVGALHFADGIPGFPDAHGFTLVQWGGEGSPFSLLQSIDEEGLRFVVVPPELFFPDYAPVLSDDDAARLGLEYADDAIVLVVVTLGERPEDATANLLGPIVINRHSLAAAQVVLTGQDLSTRQPLTGP